MRMGVIPADGSYVPSTEVLPEATRERAAQGNKFEKVKLAKCGSAAWSVWAVCAAGKAARQHTA